MSANLNDIVLGEANLQWIYKSLTNDVIIRTNSSLALKSTVKQVAFGLLSGLSAVSEFDTAIPNSGKLEVQFMHDYASFKASIGGLFHDTNIGISPVFGTKYLSFGIDLLVQTNNLHFMTYNASFAYTCKEDRTSSITLNGVARELRTSYHEVIDSNTSVGFDFNYSFLNRMPILTMGLQHSFDQQTWLKARADSTGQVNVVFQYFCLRVSGECRLRQVPRIGLGITLSL